MSLVETNGNLNLVQETSPAKARQLPPPPNHWRSFLSEEAPLVNSYEEVLNLSTPEYLMHINNLAREVITSSDYTDKKTGYLAPETWKYMVDRGLLASVLGDRDHEKNFEEGMQIGRILSYYQTALGLMFGINWGLALKQFERFSNSEEQKMKYIQNIRDGKRYGLAITELNRSGSAALKMDSRYTKHPDGTITLDFAKQFQGLSNCDGLIVLANRDGRIGRIGLFIVDQQDIETKTINTMGLNLIPYGENVGSVRFANSDQFMSEPTLKEFRDIFNKSRFQFIGMTLGQQERTEQEAATFAAEHEINNLMQDNMPLPHKRLEQIRTRRIITESMFNKVVSFRKDGLNLLDADTLDLSKEAAIIKVLSTQYSVESAKRRAILKGCRSYRKDDALQEYINMLPFEIFEGSEDMLYTEIGHSQAESRKPPYLHEQNDGVFDQLNTTRNLTLESRNHISQIVPIMTALSDIKNDPEATNKRTILEEIYGQIVARCFAIGCLYKDGMDPQDFHKAKKMLNLEINQTTREFFDELYD